MSSVQGDYRLLFLNTVTSEHFFAIRKGRGPGEIIQGSSLHKCGDGVAYYDVNNAVCVKLRVKEGYGESHIVIDTIGVFKTGPSKPVYMTGCGDSGFISGNLADEKVWYSYYDRSGKIYSSVDALDFDEISGREKDAKLSFLLSSKYASSPDGTKVCVVSVASPSLSFAHVSSGNLAEYKRWAVPPVGMVAGHVTSEHTSAFSGIDADEHYVYVIYSGHRFKDVLPTNECNHLIVYDWDGNPVKHYYLNRNVSSIHVDGNDLWAASAYPESCVYRFVLDLS